MMLVNMNPMPLKVIGREAYSHIKCPFEPLKDLKPKRYPNIFWIWAHYMLSVS